MKLVPYNEIPAGEDVDLNDVQGILSLYSDMIEFAKTSGYPLGLSAVQLGIPKKLFIARPQIVPYQQNLAGSSALDRLYQCFINCEYTCGKDRREVKSIESCLSIPDKVYEVNRFAYINVKGYAFNINPDTLESEITPVDMYIHNMYMSVVLQHEIDHQHGILISDLGEEV